MIQKCNGPLSPSVTKVFNKVKHEATKYQVDWNGADLYQVVGPWQDQVVVNLEKRLCSCRKWEVSGLPCKHAVACINNMNENGLNGGLPEHWVHDSYKLETWKKQYSHKINPITGRHYWEKHAWPSTLIPPKSHPQIGRPPKKRKKSILEVDELVKGGKLSKRGGTSTCSNCKQQGHNKRGCKMPRQGFSEGTTSGKKAGGKGNGKKAAASGNGAGSSGNAAASGSQPARVTQTSQPIGNASPIKRTKRTANKYLSPTK